MPPIPLTFGPGTTKGKYGLDNSGRIVNAHALPLGDGGKATFGLYNAPGLRTFVTVPTKGYRGGIVVNDVAYVVMGRALYAISAFGDVTAIGAIPGDGYVCAVSNDATQQVDPYILFNAAGKVYTLHSGVFQEFQTDALPPVVDLEFCRGRFIFAIADGRFFYSDFLTEANDYTLTVNALNFYNAEGKPDGLVGVWVRRNEIWLMGSLSVEVWQPTENAEDPFSPLGGGSLPYGCTSGASIAENNDDIFWVDQLHHVRRAQGYKPTDIATPWVKRALEAEPDHSAIVGYIYSLGGQQYYEIAGQNFTARYSLDTNQWTERETRGMTRWRGQGTLDVGTGSIGKTLVGDWKTGDVWVMDGDYPYDGDEKIIVRAQSPIMHAFPMPLSIYSLHVDMIAGAHDDGSDAELASPEVLLRMSEDGGKSYDGYLREPLWREGEMGRVVFRQLGTYERQGATAELSYWAGVGKCVLSAIINGQDGST